MDAYPPDYVQHNLPFLVLSGLATSKELDPPPRVHDVLPGCAVTSISSEIAVLTSDRASELLQEFLTADGTAAPWNGRGFSRRGITHGFRIRAVGRVGMRLAGASGRGPQLTAVRPSSSRPRRLMRLQPLPRRRQAAPPSQQQRRGPCTRPYPRCPQHPPPSQTA